MYDFRKKSLTVKLDALEQSVFHQLLVASRKSNGDVRPIGIGFLLSKLAKYA
jgi:hypothetical protein